MDGETNSFQLYLISSKNQYGFAREYLGILCTSSVNNIRKFSALIGGQGLRYGCVCVLRCKWLSWHAPLQLRGLVLVFVLFRFSAGWHFSAYFCARSYFFALLVQFNPGGLLFSYSLVGCGWSGLPRTWKKRALSPATSRRDISSKPQSTTPGAKKTLTGFANVRLLAV